MRRERSGAGGGGSGTEGCGRTGRHRQTAADRQTLRRKGCCAEKERKGDWTGESPLAARSLTHNGGDGGDDDRDGGDDGEKQKREAQMELDIILERRRRSTGRLALLPHSDFT